MVSKGVSKTIIINNKHKQRKNTVRYYSFENTFCNHFHPCSSKKKKIKMNSKRLTRSYSNSIIGGVCGGLGNYFDLDPVLVRAIFLLLFLLGGGGLLLYLILWIVVPRDTAYYTPYQEEKPPDNPNTTFDSNRTSATTPNNSGSTTAYILGIAFVIFGTMLLMHKLFFISFTRLWPIGLIIVGLVLIFVHLHNNKKIES
jgi:phage shock protein C